jgi:hypothetical protein
MNRLEFIYLSLYGFASKQDAKSETIQITNLNKIKQWAIEDSRLNTLVSVNSPYICLGELISTIRHQSNITINISDNDGAAGEVISLVAEKISVIDILSALLSMLSYKNAEWVMEKTSDKNYQIVRPKKVRDFTLIITEEMRFIFLELLEEQIRVSKLNQENRKEAAKQNPLLLPMTDDSLCMEMQIFESFFPSKSDRKNLYNNPQEILFRKEDWTPAARDYVLKSNSKSTTLNPKSDYNDLNIISFQFKKDAIEASPYISFLIGNENTRQGGSVCGGIYLEDMWQKKLRSLWIFPGDEESIIFDTPTSNKPEIFRSANQEWNDIVNFSRQYNIPIIIRTENLPPVKFQLPNQFIGIDAPPPKDGLNPSKYFLKAFQNQRGHFKRRNGVLLMTNHQLLFRDEQNKIPWSFRKWFNQELSTDKNKLIPFTTICQLCKKLNTKQLIALGKRNNFFQDIVDHQAILSELEPCSQSLASNKEVLWNDLPPRERQKIKNFIIDKNAKIHKITLISMDQKSDNLWHRIFHIDFINTSETIFAKIILPVWISDSTML